MKTVLAAVLKAVGIALLFVAVTLAGIIAGVSTILLRASPIILAALVCVWVLAGCTTNVTIDNSVIDQSDVTQVLGCGYEVYDEAID